MAGCGAAARALVLTVYLEAGLVAVALGLVRDPFFDPSCWANCTDNVFLLRSLPGLARESSRRTDGSPSSQRSL